jgi:iron complex transport system substrate-binding protein
MGRKISQREQRSNWRTSRRRSPSRRAESARCAERSSGIILLLRMRIVCLSAEAADICYRLAVWDQVVAVSAFCSNRLSERPIVSGFSTANLPKILETSPDLVITFSDVQAGIAERLIRAGCQVLALNHRSLQGIADTIEMIARLAGVPDRGRRLARSFLAELEGLRYEPAVRPRVYFEEWDDPLVSGIEWTSEIIQIAGGENVFPAAGNNRASERIVSREEVIFKDPEIILASWCGKTVNLPSILARDGWLPIRAIQDQHVYAIDSNNILQASPSVVDGLRQIRKIVQDWCAQKEKGPAVSNGSIQSI